MRTLLAFATILVAASCSPQLYSLHLEQRGASQSGLDLAGKSIAVTYLESGFGRDSVFALNMADGFAAEMEADYFDGQQTIGLYRMLKDMGRDYSEKDTLVNLVMDTGGDVVFLFDVPEFGTMTMSSRKYHSPDSSKAVVSFPCSIAMYVYDSMDKRDTVRVFRGNTSISQAIVLPNGLSDAEAFPYVWNELTDAGVATGRKAAGRFLSTWTGGQFSLYYFDTNEYWAEALSFAREFRWQEAMDIWLQLVTKKNANQRMCAAYNLAVACYILGQYDLAEQWLNLSDQDGPSSLSAGMHKRINTRKNL